MKILALCILMAAVSLPAFAQSDLEKQKLRGKIKVMKSDVLMDVKSRVAGVNDRVYYENVVTVFNQYGDIVEVKTYQSKKGQFKNYALAQLSGLNPYPYTDLTRHTVYLYQYSNGVRTMGVCSNLIDKRLIAVEYYDSAGRETNSEYASWYGTGIGNRYLTWYDEKGHETNWEIWNSGIKLTESRTSSYGDNGLLIENKTWKNGVSGSVIYSYDDSGLATNIQYYQAGTNMRTAIKAYRNEKLSLTEFYDQPGGVLSSRYGFDDREKMILSERYEEGVLTSSWKSVFKYDTKGNPVQEAKFIYEKYGKDYEKYTRIYDIRYEYYE